MAVLPVESTVLVIDKHFQLPFLPVNELAEWLAGFEATAIVVTPAGFEYVCKRVVSSCDVISGSQSEVHQKNIISSLGSELGAKITYISSDDPSHVIVCTCGTNKQLARAATPAFADTILHTGPVVEISSVNAIVGHDHITLTEAAEVLFFVPNAKHILDSSTLEKVTDPYCLFDAVGLTIDPEHLHQMCMFLLDASLDNALSILRNGELIKYLMIENNTLTFATREKIQKHLEPLLKPPTPPRLLRNESIWY